MRLAHSSRNSNPDAEQVATVLYSRWYELGRARGQAAQVQRAEGGMPPLAAAPVCRGLRWRCSCLREC
eukprot:4208370-Alexandrium_andersonii.AAC.1